MPAPRSPARAPAMSALRGRRSWGFRRHSALADARDAVVVKVNRATAADRPPHARALCAAVTDAVAADGAPAADAAVAAIARRLAEPANPRSAVLALELTDAALQTLTAGPFRAAVAGTLLPRVVAVARGLPLTTDAPRVAPAPVVRDRARRLIEAWAAPSSYTYGDLAKAYPAFSYAFSNLKRDSPAQFNAYDPSSAKRRPGESSAATPALPRLPVDDAELVQYLGHRVSAFDRLHVIDRVPLTDPRIARIRHELEEAMPRLSALTDGQRVSGARADALKVKPFAERLLERFPDYTPRPRPARDNFDAPNTPASFMHPSQPLPPPPAYPPPPQRMHAANGSIADYQRHNPGGHGHHPDVTPAQKCLLASVHNTFPPSSFRHSSSSNWMDAPFAQLPDEFRPSFESQPPRYGHRPVHHGLPPHPPPPPLLQHNATYGGRLYPPSAPGYEPKPVVHRRSVSHD